jgi:hypothetical protein
MNRQPTTRESVDLRRSSSRVVCRRPIQRISRGIGPIAGAMLLVASTVYGSEAEDRRNLALLDTKYQRAVKENDSKTMAAILANNFVVIGGDGKQWTKADLIKSATDGSTHYEQTSGRYGAISPGVWQYGRRDRKAVGQGIGVW